MPERMTVFESLAASDNLAADAVLVQSLHRAQPPYDRYIFNTLLQRGRPFGLMQLVGRFPKLSESLQREMIAQLSQFFAPLRLCIGSKDQRLVLGALELIRKGGNFRLAYLLSAALRSASARVRTAAGEGLLELVRCYVQADVSAMDEERRLHHDEDRSFLAQAVTQALEAFDTHLQTTVIAAAAYLGETTENVILGLNRHDSPKCWRAVSEYLTTSHDPPAAGMILRALGKSDWRNAAARSIALCRRDDFMHAVIRNGWLLLDEEIAKGCAAVRRLMWLEEDIAPLLRVPEDDLPKAMRFLLHIGVPAEQKMEWFERALKSNVLPLQTEALRAMCRMEHPRAFELLRTVSTRSDPHLARIALLEVRRRSVASVAEEELLNTALQQSSPADPELDAADQIFAKYWNAFDELSDAARCEAGQAMVQEVFDVQRRLRAKLASSNSQDRLRAALVVRALGMAVEFEEQILRSVQDRDALVRSCAVSLLPELDNPAALRLARAALLDPDERVHANAIEAVGDLAPADNIDLLVPALQRENNRVQANAVKVLMTQNVREAAENLVRMLHSPVSNMRISALWVIKELHLADLIESVSQMAQNDPHPQVRKWAGQLTGTFRQSDSTEETSPAGGVEAEV